MTRMWRALCNMYSNILRKILEIFGMAILGILVHATSFYFPDAFPIFKNLYFSELKNSDIGVNLNYQWLIIIRDLKLNYYKAVPSI